MAVLLDKLSKRGIDRLSRSQSTPSATEAIRSPFQSVNQTAGAPQARPVTTAPTEQRAGALPQRGALASSFQGGRIQKRFVADLPQNEQIQGIQTILSGQSSGNQIIDNFVKGMAAQGRQPEEIRQAFIAQQKASGNPLVLV